MSTNTQTRAVDIGIFAHNEAKGIAQMLRDLCRQDIFRTEHVSVKVHVLANGCTDRTVAEARQALLSLPEQVHFSVVELEQGGKSRTWNAFVHELSRPEAEALICCDADIVIPEADMLSAFVATFLGNEGLIALNSRPVKDLTYRPTKLSPLEKLISLGANTLGDWKKDICGQLYALRPAFARSLYLPIGLPVEDGFVRAMVLTNTLSEPENFDVIDGVDHLFHVYKSERTIGALVRHQTRIVIGSAINTALFGYLHPLDSGSRAEALKQAGADPNWLNRVLGSSLPKWPEGWVPLHFLTKRSARLLGNPSQMLKPRSLAVFVAGLGLDLVVYVRAQYKMATGTGSGYW